MTKDKVFKLTDVVGHEDINVKYVGIDKLASNTIVITNTKQYEFIDKDGIKKTGIRIDFHYPDSAEILQTSTKSYVFLNLHEMLSEQEMYPIEINIRTENRQYILS